MTLSEGLDGEYLPEQPQVCKNGRAHRVAKARMEPLTDSIFIDEEILNVDKTGSRIAEFYKDKCVFVTGATGFLGKILVEKLLRACEDLQTIYILIRDKKGKDIHTRMDEIYGDVVSETVLRVKVASAASRRLILLALLRFLRVIHRLLGNISGGEEFLRDLCVRAVRLLYGRRFASVGVLGSNGILEFREKIEGFRIQGGRRSFVSQKRWEFEIGAGTLT